MVSPINILGTLVLIVIGLWIVGLILMVPFWVLERLAEGAGNLWRRMSHPVYPQHALNQGDPRPGDLPDAQPSSSDTFPVTDAIVASWAGALTAVARRFEMRADRKLTDALRAAEAASDRTIAERLRQLGEWLRQNAVEVDHGIEHPTSYADVRANGAEWIASLDEARRATTRRLQRLSQKPGGFGTYFLARFEGRALDQLSMWLVAHVFGADASSPSKPPASRQ